MIPDVTTWLLAAAALASLALYGLLDEASAVRRRGWVLLMASTILAFLALTQETAETIWEGRVVAFLALAWLAAWTVGRRGRTRTDPARSPDES